MCDVLDCQVERSRDLKSINLHLDFARCDIKSKLLEELLSYFFGIIFCNNQINRSTV